MSFDLNYRYHLCIIFEKNVYFHSRSKAANELTEKLKNLMAICRENL